VNLDNQKIDDKNRIMLLFWICWIAYFSTYLGRLNYNAVIVEIVQSGFSTKTQAGLVSTSYFFMYGIGQFFSGMLADKLNPRKLMIVGLVSSSILNIAMSVAPANIMPVIWGINGLALSLTWSPIMRIFAEKLNGDDLHRLSVHFGTCSVAGSLGAYVMCSAVVYFLSWKWVFIASASFMLVSVILWIAGMKKIYPFDHKTKVTEKSKTEKSSESGNVARLILASGLIYVIPAVLAQGALKDGITTWAPTFLYEQFGVDSVLSMLLTAVFPVINIFGVYLGAFVNKCLFHRELTASYLFFAVSAAGIAVLMISNHMVLSLLVLTLITTVMYSINLLIVGIMPLKFASYGRAATITGILNSLVYLGSALSTYGISLVTQSAGWFATFLMWLGIALLGFGFCMFGNRCWEKFKSNERGV